MRFCISKARANLGVAAVMCALGALAADARAVLLTFEDLDATNTTLGTDTNSNGTFDPLRNGLLTSLSSDIDDISFTISRRGGAAFDIIDHSLTGPRAFTSASAPTSPDT